MKNNELNNVLSPCVGIFMTAFANRPELGRSLAAAASNPASDPEALRRVMYANTRIMPPATSAQVNNCMLSAHEIAMGPTKFKASPEQRQAALDKFNADLAR